MIGAGTIFTGSLALVCQMGGGETARLAIGQGSGQITGMEDEAVELGLIPYLGTLGSLRLVAMVRRAAETTNWADLRPDRKLGGYSLAWYSRTGRAKPVIWSRGHCVAETAVANGEGTKK